MVNPENKEGQKFISLADATRKLGQAQYVSRFLNPDPNVRGDIPYFPDIRVEGDLDNYHNIKIHPDDVQSFIKQWFEYKKSTGNPFFTGKKLEDFL